MNYAKIKWTDIADGPGVRVTLYVSGCRNHCKGCFNPETWDFCYGEPFTREVEDSIIKALEPEHIRGFTVVGGDPFEPENAAVIAPFLERVRAAYPEKSIWAYSGYTYDELLTGKRIPVETILKIFNCLDVLVDGRFVESQKDLSLRFRGSSNQRVILMKKSLECDDVVLWDGEEVI